MINDGYESGSISISDESNNNWDFFVRLDEDLNELSDEEDSNPEPEGVARNPLAWPLPETQPPIYILEASLEEQALWYKTAGQRPVQPPEERRYFESIWKDNFEKSEANLSVTIEQSEHNSDRVSLVRKETREDVVFRGQGPFSHAVSKSFPNCSPPSMTLQIPRFEIRRGPDGSQHAEYLVVVSINRLTFGIWRRYSAFKELYHQVAMLNMMPDLLSEFNGSIISWELVERHQHFTRCLEAHYIAGKCDLLEKFIHKVLFESPDPILILKFLGLAS